MDLVKTVARLAGGGWELFKDDRGVAVVANEIRSAGASKEESAMIVAEVRKLMKLAELGALTPYVDVDVIQRRRNMFELRWEIGGDTHNRKRLWRLYFVWQPTAGPIRRALRFAEKSREARWRWRQDRDIDVAWQRFLVWSSRSGAR